ncbi:hypothetical protein HDU76_014102 [Blyttiomyces sp. JEL0837]|nr:hypothetical protein HDU76_014102 [Blyttiomyces sp. JEL0837]
MKRYNTEWCKYLLPSILQSTLPVTPSGEPPTIQLLTLFLGANDAVLPGCRQEIPIPQYISNLREMLSVIRTQSPRTRVVVITPPPIDPTRWGAHCITKGRELDRAVENTKRYRDACLSVGNEMLKSNEWEGMIAVVDTWDVFLGKGKGDLPYNFDDVRDILSDGLHLASKGNMLLADALLDVIKTIWPEMDPEVLTARVPYHDQFDINGLPDSLFVNAR